MNSHSHNPKKKEAPFSKKTIVSALPSESPPPKPINEQNIKVLNAHLMTFSKQLSSIHQRLDHKINTKEQPSSNIFNRIIPYFSLTLIVLVVAYCLINKLSLIEKSLNESHLFLDKQHQLYQVKINQMKDQNKFELFQKRLFNQQEQTDSLLKNLSISLISLKQETQKIPQQMSIKIDNSIKKSNHNLLKQVKKELNTTDIESFFQTLITQTQSPSSPLNELKILYNNKNYERLINQALPLFDASQEPLIHPEIVYYYIIASYYQMGFIDTALKWCEKSILKFKDKRVLKILLKSKTVKNIEIEPYFKYLLNF